MPLSVSCRTRRFISTRRASLVAIGLLVLLLSACAGKSSGDTPTTDPTPSPTPTPAPGPAKPVYVVLFTHIEDNTPAGTIGSAATRTAYTNLRTRLIEMGQLAQRYNVRWSFEPDWKFLLAAQQYEDAAMMASTSGTNVLVYLRDRLGVAIDPHSHENGGYNYTDVAYLLAQFGVGGSTVIGGHIWDPSLPQFQQWDRFRVPVRGQHYPSASWRGDILMGSGTPNHVNDPIVSGVWRPRDRNRYWEDDPSGNIACVGAYTGDVAGVMELAERARSGQSSPACMLTASIHLLPADLTDPGGVAAVEQSVVAPLAGLQSGRQVETTDFTSLVATWRADFGGQACLYSVKTALWDSR